MTIKLFSNYFGLYTQLVDFITNTYTQIQQTNADTNMGVLSPRNMSQEKAENKLL